MEDGAPQCQPGQGGGNDRGKFYGKYRGTVIDNVDLLGLGRVIAFAPAVQGSLLNWALPCTPYAGLLVGFWAIPPIGANVWIEFEGGNPDHPIWSGCFWEEGEVPFAQELSPEDPALVKVFRTDFITMIFNDTPEIGGVTINVMDPAVDVPLTILMNSAGIEIQAGVSNILINPEEGITMTVADNVIAMSEAGVAINGNTIAATSEAGTTIDAGAGINITGGGDVAVSGGGAVEVTAGGDVAVSGGGAAELTGGGDVAVTGGGAAELTGGGDVAVSGGGAAEVTGGGDVAITGGGAAEVTAGADVAVTGGAAIQITAIADVMTTGITQVQNGIIEVDGDLLIDGLQPLVI